MLLYAIQLTCFFALGHCCTNLRVHQKPESMHLREGSSVNLTCTLTYNLSSIPTSFSVNWYKNSEVISFQRFNVSGNSDFTVSLPLHSVHRNQSGKYFCNVSILIPCMERKSGRGSNITIDVPPPPVIESPSRTVLGLSMAGVLAVGIGCLIYGKRKGNSRIASSGQGSNCPTTLHEVVYAKLNIRNLSTQCRDDSGQTQLHLGNRTPDSKCLRLNVEEDVLYSTLKTTAPDH
ncbi:hypothetical protein GJAV_G00031050 [Gymnothorax javanicus]|nr:hypothetical protein GJAV_G00031050 [Gymnothorax javanicus]